MKKTIIVIQLVVWGIVAIVFITQAIKAKNVSGCVASEVKVALTKSRTIASRSLRYKSMQYNCR